MAERGGLTALYDLSVDPGEDHPIDDPERSRELAAQISAWKARYSEVAEEMPIEKQRELLRQMGYLGLANELDQNTTPEEVRELLKAGRARREARRARTQDGQRDAEQDG